MENIRPKRPAALRAWAMGALLPLAVWTVAQGQERALNASLKEQVGIGQAASKSQTRVAQLADQTTELLGEYRVTSQQLDRVKIYNGHLQTLVNDQEAEKVDIDRQLTDFVVVEQEIIPLMMEMINDLDLFINADLPFHLEERETRVRTLRDNMDKANITISEKYRQIMNAYQVEVDFGRTIDTYVGDLHIGDATRQVDFLRVGRILLAYQTLNRSETGFYNKKTGDWEPLDNEYRRPITEGIRIARKQAPPNLLKLPIHAPEQSE